MQGLKYDWNKEEISAIYHKPFLDLVYEAASIKTNFVDDTKMFELFGLKIRPQNTVAV